MYTKLEVKLRLYVMSTEVSGKAFFDSRGAFDDHIDIQQMLVD